MSLPDRVMTACKPIRLAFGVAALAVTLAGCTVQPLYSSNGSGTATVGGNMAPDMRMKLASIAVDPANTIFEQAVRNRLIFLLGGGAGEPAIPAYRVRLGLSSATLAAVNVDLGDRTDTTGRPSAGTVRATSNFVVLDLDGKPVARGNRVVSASFDRPRQEFANLRAERDAQQRAAEELAEQVFLALAQKVSKL